MADPNPSQGSPDFHPDSDVVWAESLGEELAAMRNTIDEPEEDMIHEPTSSEVSLSVPEPEYACHCSMPRRALRDVGTPTIANDPFVAG